MTLLKSWLIWQRPAVTSGRSLLTQESQSTNFWHLPLSSFAGLWTTINLLLTIFTLWQHPVSSYKPNLERKETQGQVFYSWQILRVPSLSSLNATPALYFLITILLCTPALPGVLHAQPGWHFSVIFTLSIREGSSSLAAGLGSRGQLAVQHQSYSECYQWNKYLLGAAGLRNYDTYTSQILDS